MPQDLPHATMLDERLRLGTGFAEGERPMVIERLGGLERRLASYQTTAVDLEISVKERDGADQRVTLECWIAGLPQLVAVSSHREIEQAVGAVRDELVRQITDETNRREPRHNRHLRETI